MLHILLSMTDSAIVANAKESSSAKELSEEPIASLPVEWLCLNNVFGK